MDQQTTEPTVASSPTWERLEMWLRSTMREWMQDLLDAEVDELLGRRKSARRKAVDGAPGSRSGHGKPEAADGVELWHGHGPVALRPVRGLE